MKWLNACFFLVLTSLNSSAATLYVNCASGDDKNDGSAGGSAKSTIQSAVDAAANGDIIVVAAGVYDKGGRQTGDATGRVVIDKKITLKGADAKTTHIVGGKDFRGVFLGSGAVINGFTIRDGNAKGSSWASNCGGGVYCADATAKIEDCIITNNTAALNGGGVCHGTVIKTKIAGNRLSDAGSTSNGGAGAFGADLQECSIVENRVPRGENKKYGYGAGVHSCKLSKCDVMSNIGYYCGGAFKSTLRECRIVGNTGKYFKEAAESELIDCVVGCDLLHKTDPLAGFMEKCTVSGKTDKYFVVKMPSIIGSNMVLQQGAKIPVWGWGTPGKRIVVSFAGQSASTVVGNDSKWKLMLDPLPVSKTGRSMDISVDGAEKITLDDILVGEVWLCAGQSNMWLTMAEAKTTGEDFAPEPRIRLFSLELDLAAKWETPQDNCTGDWRKPERWSINMFSATGYFFGKALVKDLDTPVGLIRSAIGDSMAEAWTSNDTLRRNPINKDYMSEWDAKIANYKGSDSKTSSADKPGSATPKQLHPAAERNRPSRLYNGYIAPLIPFAIRGVIFYQGEGNATPDRRVSKYSTIFRDLITDWREKWGCADMPFIFVQLPNFGGKMDAVDPAGIERWPGIREAQADALTLPNTAMAVTIDAGEDTNIHPRDKKTVGERLALAALGTVYHKTNVCYSGPLYDSHRIVDGKVEIKFKYADGGLAAKGGGELKGFFVAGSDNIFHKAKTQINPDNTISVWSEEVKIPQSVRYAWAGNPECNLQNKAGLPASPFRTDRNKGPVDITK